MADRLRMIAPLAGVRPGELQFGVRRIDDDDRDALGRLYFDSYEPGVACESLKEAIEVIEASLDGESREQTLGQDSVLCHIILSRAPAMAHQGSR